MTLKIQQDAIEATILPSNAALVVFAKGVHQQPPADPRQPDSAAHSPPSRKLSGKGISRAEPLECLEELEHLAAPELLSNHNLFGRVDPVDLERVLGDIQTDGGDLYVEGALM